MEKSTETIKSVAQNIPPPPSPEQKLIPIGSYKFAKVCKYHGKTYVNIRHYIKGDKGRLYSTKKSVLLTPSEWRILKKSVKDIDKELKNMKC